MAVVEAPATVEVDCEGCTAPCCRGFTFGQYGQRFKDEGVIATPAHAAIAMADIWESETGGRATVRLGWPNDLHPIAFEQEIAKLGPHEFDGFDLPRLSCTALSDDGRCTVYEHRPTACRIYSCVNDPVRAKAMEGARCAWPKI